MNREIKFRIWDSENSDGATMHYTDSLTAFENCVCADINFKPPYYNNSDGKILMQYTGLKDNNDKDIYEGDILMPTRYKGMIGGSSAVGYACEVIFHKGFFCFRKNGVLIQSDRPLCNSLYLADDANNQYEIVGNIYENPELINPQTPNQ